MPGELGELARAFDTMAEAQERETRARAQLVADLSHEVRTPMTILRGNLEELIDGIEAPTPDRLASLHEEILRLDGLIQHLDALGRAGTTIREPDREPVELSELIRAALEALTPQFTAKQLIVHHDLVPVVVHGDRVKLGQVVANLLSNALKFAPGRGTIDVTVVADDSAGEAVLVVADDGPGLPREERERAFDRFWRGSAAAGVAGRGIGLAVVQEIVHAHGGTAAVDEGPRGGARFTIRLPRPTRSPAAGRTAEAGGDY
jgi:two-component system sensor histidine kinase BaeS